MINPSQGLDDEMLQLVSGEKGSHGSGKHLMTEDRTKIFKEFQVTTGSGFCLQDLQILSMNVRAAITLDRLWLCS